MTTVSRMKALLQKGIDRSFPIPSPYSWDDCYTDFVRKNSLNVNTGSITVWSMYAAMRLLKGEGGDNLGFHFGEVRTVVGAPWDEHWQTGEVTKGLYETASVLTFDQCAKAGIYLLDLVGANQVAALDEKNIESYFKAAGCDIQVNMIHKALPYLSSYLENVMSEPDFVTRTRDFEWLKYHTTYASGNGLVLKMLEATGTTLTDPGPFKVPAEIVRHVKKAVEDPFDKVASDHVPSTLKGIAHVYLESIQMLPAAKWYQGERGRSNLTVSAVAAIKAFAIKLTEIKANTKEISDSKTVAEAIQKLHLTGAVPSVV
jgi:hypothetical protein